jgi:hypothetical protein
MALEDSKRLLELMDPNSLFYSQMKQLHDHLAVISISLGDF